MKAINRKGSRIRASNIRRSKHQRCCCCHILYMCYRFCVLTKGSALATWHFLGRIRSALCASSRRKPSMTINGSASEIRNEKLETLCSVIHPPLFFPDNTYRALWDCMLTLLVIYYSLAVPLRMAFDLASPTDTENIFDIVIGRPYKGRCCT